jgi:hypothetical protein
MDVAILEGLTHCWWGISGCLFGGAWQSYAPDYACRSTAANGFGAGEITRDQRSGLRQDWHNTWNGTMHHKEEISTILGEW